jgi:hypothetical protein
MGKSSYIRITAFFNVKLRIALVVNPLAPIALNFVTPGKNGTPITTHWNAILTMSAVLVTSTTRLLAGMRCNHKTDTTAMSSVRPLSGICRN